MNQKKIGLQRRSIARSSRKPKKSGPRRLSAETAAQVLDLICCSPAEAFCRANTAFSMGASRSRGSASAGKRY